MNRTYTRQLKGKQSRGQIIWWMLLLMLSECGTVDEKDTMYIDTESVIQQLNASNNMKEWGNLMPYFTTEKDGTDIRNQTGRFFRRKRTIPWMKKMQKNKKEKWE